LHAIAGGVPRSFPFDTNALHHHAPAFCEFVPESSGVSRPAEMISGILLSDSWWVNGRQRSLSACVLVDADPTRKDLPSPPTAVAAVLAQCGKVRKTVQAPFLLATEAAASAAATSAGDAPAVRTASGTMVASPNPAAARSVQAIISDYRTRIAEIVTRAALPHLLPAPGEEAYRDAPPGVTPGPKKPVLARTFKPMGYTCRGGSGTFTLRRRTPTNLTVELHLDVGTWSNLVLAMFRVWGLGFKGTLMVPVSANAVPAVQYPIGGADRWQMIVDNLAALVRELDRTLVPEIEAATGPSPEWYQPEA
jgi:hypothetical protein